MSRATSAGPAFGRNGLHIWPTPGSVTRVLAKTSLFLPFCMWLHLTLAGEPLEAAGEQGRPFRDDTLAPTAQTVTPALPRVCRPRAGLPFPARRASFWRLRDVPWLRGWRWGWGGGSSASSRCRTKWGSLLVEKK